MLLEQEAVRAEEAPALRPLHGVGLYHADPVERLFEHGEHRGPTLQGLSGRPLHSLPELADQEEDGRSGDHRQQRQPPRENKRHPHRPDCFCRFDDCLPEQRDLPARNLVGVLDEPRHRVGRSLLGEVRYGDAQDDVIHLAAQVDDRAGDGGLNQVFLGEAENVPQVRDDQGEGEYAKEHLEAIGGVLRFGDE